MMRKLIKDLRQVKANYALYIMLLPLLALVVVFRYLPMGGVIMAFQNYNIVQGLSKSPFVGLKHFYAMFTDRGFLNAFRNTLVINFWKYLLYTPAPMILAILIYELPGRRFKRMVQTISYFPYFISWIIVFGILMNLLNIQDGVINQLIKSLGGQPAAFLVSKKYFIQIIVISDIWKFVGFDSIVYLAALAAVDPQLYEAAKIDGAGKLSQIWRITVPCISGTFFIMLILSLGRILDAGHDQIIALYSRPVYEVADVLTTYVYRTGITSMRYSYAAAIGLFSSVIGLVMVCASNYLSGKFSETSIW
jgi:putative aldouronate transport system permease protein